MKTSLLLLPLLFVSCLLPAQTNVRAWYAQGQVWVIWEIDTLPGPTTYKIYKSNTAFASTAQATQVGRPFVNEYVAFALKNQANDNSLTYRIPKPDNSTYTLALNEALFVETVQAHGSSYYGVVEPDSNQFHAGVNLTDTAVSYTYDPVREPVRCHWQHSEVVTGGFKVNWYQMWMLGKQNSDGGRPDFPVMANVFKNGMPNLFAVSEAVNMDTTAGKKIPATNWLHGGGGNARQYLPHKARHFNIQPQEGICVAHNDMLSLMVGSFPHVVTTKWFGYAKSMNPFDPLWMAGQGDTIFDYTQRRILWINDWLTKNYAVDPAQVSLMGYSMGSAGVLSLAKLHPERFSSVSMFNNGFRHSTGTFTPKTVGDKADNLPINHLDASGNNFHVLDLWPLNKKLSPTRDFPILFSWAGKNDSNDRMHWGPNVVRDYKVADSLGWGAFLYWDERQHTYSGKLGMHWIIDYDDTLQTQRDNLAVQQLFRSDQSFPAFHNHQQDAQSPDPGMGIQGTGMGDGADWGTWGGFHTWDLNHIIDAAGEWEVRAWLTDQAIFPNDNCPVDSLIADVAIRRPQAFLPAPGTSLNWEVREVGSNALLQAGMTQPKVDGLVVVPAVAVYRRQLRAVKIRVWDPQMVSIDEGLETEMLKIYPNPTDDFIQLDFRDQLATAYDYQIVDLQGRSMLTGKAQARQKINIEGLSSGLYFVKIVIKKKHYSGKFLVK